MANAMHKAIVCLAAAAAAISRLAGAEGVEPQDCATVSSIVELDQSGQAVYAAYGAGSPQEAALKAELATGVLRVTAPPYNADPTGASDSTNAIQAAVCDARDARAVCFFPPGAYKISKQIRAVRPAATKTAAHTGTYKYGRNYPSVLAGSRESDPPLIFLQDGSTGFGNPSVPKAMFYFWAVWIKDGPAEPDREQSNISMHHRFENLRLATGANPGAVGLYFETCQQAVIEDVEVDATGGFAGVNGIAGSGGATRNLKVVNGQYGIYLLGGTTQPQPTVAGAILTGQTVANLYNDSSGPLTLVGCEMSGPGIICDTIWEAGSYRAHMSLLDCKIDLMGGDGTAVRSERNVYLGNVWVRNAAKIVAFNTGQTVAGNPGGWAHVAEYAGGSGTIAAVTSRYLDGVSTTADLSSIDLAPAGSPPADLVSRHLPPTTPSFTDAGIVNAKAFGALGNGTANDAPALQNAINAADKVFIPKGEYKLSSPLTLRSTTQLFGIGDRYTQLFADAASPNFNNAANPKPMIDTPDDALAATSLARLWVNCKRGAAGAYAIRWRVGRQSIVRDIKIEYCENETGTEPTNSRYFPVVLIEGSGGGRWYTLAEGDGAYSLEQSPEFVHIRANGTIEPLLFYHLNGEGAPYPRANAEFLNAKNFVVYGFKHEESANAVRAINCQDFRVYGHGGIGGGESAGQEVYSLQNCDNFLLTNLTLQTNDLAPRNWNMVEEMPPGGGAPVAVAGERRVLYYKRGEPAPLPSANAGASSHWRRY